LFTILGIAVRNAVVLIRRYQQLEDHEGIAFGPELILRGAGERYAPVMITAITTAVAFLPFVITGNVPGQEILYPLAIAILAGLVSSTLLNLFVMPALYLRFGAVREADLGLQPAAPADAITGDAVAGD
jgi:Cu/Ag efflux pump CusA